MKLIAPQAITVKTGAITIKGQGSSAFAHKQAHSIAQGLEYAVREISSRKNLQGNLHLEKIKIRIPHGANDKQIADSMKQALEESLQSAGGRDERI